jgi:EsV-1-7 cysteine-rich motif
MTFCKYVNCKKRASFNYENEKPLYCKSHIFDKKMINVKDKKCIICDITQPIFNYEYENKALYCKKCKKDDMIDVKNRKCIKCKRKQPSFNIETETTPLYCGKCKEDDMVNIVTRKCIICNITHPSFNYEYENKPLYCKKCKKNEMINVGNRKCIKCKEKQPCFNVETEKTPLYCEKCKEDNMIDIIHKKCIKCNITRSCFNKKNEKVALYCKDCKEIDMIDIIHKKCIECKFTRAIDKYADHCLRCFIYKFPDNEISRNYKVKEKHVQDFIEEKFPKIFRFDKQIDGGCSKRRPDAFKDCLTHVLIIEIDEYQHKNYEEICENRRMMEIFKDTNNRPVVFIRFNPDKYINAENKIIDSCFDINKKLDVPFIKNKKDWSYRTNKLKKHIENNIKNIPEKEVSIINLFFDFN